MTAALRLPASAREAELPSSSRRVVDHVASLTTIFDPTVNVVMLRRALSPILVEEARRATIQTEFHRLFVVEGETVTLRRVQDELASLPHLAADVLFWVEALADLTGSDRIGVRLARMDTAMCPRFHVDRILLRVVTTYEGQGTEYIASEHADRRRLGHAAGRTADEASGLLLAPDCVQAAGPGDVVLLKGENWPENAGRGAIHRSPRSGRTRLVMTLDPL